MMWWKIIIVVFVLLIAIILVIIFSGSKRWDGQTRELQARLHAAQGPISPSTYDPAELEGLPPPVQRYFQIVLPVGQPIIKAVTVIHEGTFNLSEAQERWQPFKSEQRVVTKRPGFVWDARIRMAPGLTAFVHDAYVVGEGILTAKLFGFLTVMEQSPTPELAQGELMRFLAEGAWYPTVLLPSQGVIWEDVSEKQARATLRDGDITVTLLFEFDDDGLIRSAYSESRYREENGVMAATPWKGIFWEYERREGMLIPLAGEVSWLLPESSQPYWRGNIQDITFEYVP